MATFICQRCGAPFQSTRRQKRMACPGECFRAMEAIESHTRRTAFSGQRQFAHGLVSATISRGDLKPLPCENCGSTRHVVAHHDDYSKPLDVRWLCRSCHNRHHHLFGPGAGSRTETNASTEAP